MIITQAANGDFVVRLRTICFGVSERDADQAAAEARVEAAYAAHMATGCTKMRRH